MATSTNSEAPLFQTCTGLAKEIGVSPSTVRRWVLIGAIPERVEVVPGVHRFYMPDVYEAIKAMRDRAGKVTVEATGAVGKQPLGLPDTREAK